MDEEIAYGRFGGRAVRVCVVRLDPRETDRLRESDPTTEREREERRAFRIDGSEHVRHARGDALDELRPRRVDDLGDLVVGADAASHEGRVRATVVAHETQIDVDAVRELLERRAIVRGYSASKFAVVGLSESMPAELAPFDIGVTTICPGMIATNIVKTTRYKQRDASAARDRAVALYKRRAYGPDKVARSIITAIKAGRGVVPVSPEAWAAWYVKRFAPALTGPLARVLSRPLDAR